MNKQILFLLTLIFSLAPACKRPNKPNLAGPHGAIAAGSILTAGGAAGTPVGILAGCVHVAFTGTSGATLATSIAMGLAAPIALAIGIPLIIYGVKKRKDKIKRFKEQQEIAQAITPPIENVSQKD